MIRVVKELPPTYAVLSEGRWCGPALAVHEVPPAGSSYRASSTAPGGPSARVVPPRHSLKASTGRVRLHLKPGHKGTKSNYHDRHR